MKTLTEIRDEVTSVQSQLAQVQTDLQALIDAPTTIPDPTPTPDVPKITIPLNTPIELVTE